jgi:hypothetical protein
MRTGVQAVARSVGAATAEPEADSHRSALLRSCKYLPSPPLPAPNRQQKTPSLGDIGILKIFNYFKKQLKLVRAAACYLYGHLCESGTWRRDISPAVNYCVRK